jgi:hypothetical protein
VFEVAEQPKESRQPNHVNIPPIRRTMEPFVRCDGVGRHVFIEIDGECDGRLRPGLCLPTPRSE